VITSLRYHGEWEGPGDDRHNLAAGYSLHAATKILDSDFVYTRHEWNAHYDFRRGRSTLGLSIESGVIGGRAPLYERFVAGNSYYLRGWNKYDIAPVGGDRAALGMVDYTYRWFHLFYDNGAVWNRGEPINVKHSLGAGVKVKLFSLAVAFPLQSGHTEAVVMAGFLF
jgi:outer membrane protein assembly factor BamA